MKRFQRILCFLIMVMMLMSLAACEQGAKMKETIDYADAESFETALNNGENLEGKIVQFVVGELHPNSAFGYNIWAGKHLNFVSSRNPDVKAGDVIAAKIEAIDNVLGSWIITYKKVYGAVIGDSTISSRNRYVSDLNDESSESVESSDTVGIVGSNSASVAGSVPSLAVDNLQSLEQPLELSDCGWHISSSLGDTAYVEFCGMIYNPNENYIAQFPKVIVTVKNGDGSIVATTEQTGSIVMPKDTITLCGMFSMIVSDLTEDAQFIFDVDWGSLESDTLMYSAARTTDFAITNVTERNGSRQSSITGEITNNYSEDIDLVNLSIVLRKDGEIVYMENTFLDSLRVGKTKAFEFQQYGEWPEHDTIDVSAMVW